MNKTICALIVFVPTLFFSGCSSSNVKRFSLEYQQIHKTNLERNLTKKIVIKNVVMLNGNKNSITCRLVGKIYLPGKMTYSEYIHDAFKKVLLFADRLSDATNSNNALSIVLTKVDFDSISGRWLINATVKVGENRPVAIMSETKFGTSWIGEHASRNVSESFSEAVSDFIGKVLSNSQIIQNL